MPYIENGDPISLHMPAFLSGTYRNTGSLQYIDIEGPDKKLIIHIDRWIMPATTMQEKKKGTPKNRNVRKATITKTRLSNI